MYLASHASTTSRYQTTSKNKKQIKINKPEFIPETEIILAINASTNIFLATIFRNEQGFLPFGCSAVLHRSRKYRGNRGA